MLKDFLLKFYCVFKIFVQYRSIYFIYINRSDKNMLECKDEKILFSLFQKIIILLKKCFHKYIFLDISIFFNPFISFQLVNAIRMSFWAFLFKYIYIFFSPDNTFIKCVKHNKIFTKIGVQIILIK